MIRVLVAEDSPTVRELLVAVLEADPGIRVVAQATNGFEAVEFTKRHRPDLITMDINMPGLGGLEATKEIMVEAPTPIMVVSSTITEEAIGSSLDATRAGALMVMPTPSPRSERFESQCEQLVGMVKAMAQVKVVRRHGSRGGGAARRPAERPSIRVVAVAASTGGPAALHRILIDLPRDFPLPILVVQHIALNFVDGLCRWLNSHCNLRVRLAEHGQPLEPRTVYLAPDGHHLGVQTSGAALLSTAPPLGGFRPSGSFLFDSVAEAYGSAAVGVVLTGMGSDGADGARALHAAGGRVIAQDEASSVVYGMPAAAVRVGAVDRVLPLHEIAGALVDLTRGANHER